MLGSNTFSDDFVMLHSHTLCWKRSLEVRLGVAKWFLFVLQVFQSEDFLGSVGEKEEGVV